MAMVLISSLVAFWLVVVLSLLKLESTGFRCAALKEECFEPMAVFRFRRVMRMCLGLFCATDVVAMFAMMPFILDMATIRSGGMVVWLEVITACFLTSTALILLFRVKGNERIHNPRTSQPPYDFTTPVFMRNLTILSFLSYVSAACLILIPAFRYKFLCGGCVGGLAFLAVVTFSRLWEPEAKGGK